MEFEPVYDITNVPYNWHYPAFGLVFIGMAVVWAICVWRSENRLKRYGPLFMAGFAALWTIGVFSTTFSEWYGGRRALVDGSAAVVEGVTENFVPMPFEGHMDERFTVRGVTFCYSDYTMTSLFKNTRSHGGPMRAGLYVRVHHLGNNILKLEIRK